MWYLLLVLIAGALIWGLIRFQIWIIKTAIKEALQEYESEKQGKHGSQ